MKTSPREIASLLAMALLFLSACSSPHPASNSGAPHSAPKKSKSSPAIEISMDRRANAYAHYATGLIHEMNGRSDEAFEELVLSVQSDPANTSLVLQISRRLLENERARESRDLLKEAIIYAPEEAALHAYLGMAYAALNEPGAAIQANRQAIRILPTSLQAYQNIIHLEYQKGDKRAMLAAIDRAAAVSNTDALFLIDLSDLSLRYGQLAEIPFEKVKPRALALLNRADALDPDDPRLLVRVGDGYVKVREPEKALETFKKVQSRFAEWRQLREKQITVLNQLGRYEEAESLVDELIQIEPANPAGYLFKAGFHDTRGELAEAAGYVAKSIQVNPQLEPTYYTLIGLYLRAGETEKAHEVLDTVRLRFKPGFLMEFYTAIAHVEAKAYSEAIEHFLAAEKVGTAAELNAFFYFQLGTASERNKQYDLCELYLRKAIGKNPDFAEALNYLGYTFSEIGRNLDEAELMVKKALEIEPDNAAYLDSLSWIYFKQSKFDEALKEMLRAVEITRDDPDSTMFDHLGDIYSAQNRFDDAIQSWQKSLEITPDETIEKKLKKLRAQ